MIDFSSLSDRSALGKALRWPLQLLPARTVVPILQGPSRGTKWIVGSFNHGAWLGSFEAAKQVRFAGDVQPGDVVYDIGANVGFYTLLAATRLGESGHVIAFEPLPANVEFLERHVELNKFRNVTIVPKAVSQRCGRTRFAAGANRSQGRLDRHGNVEVETIALDEFLKSDTPVPSLMKIDVEGGELQVLHGAKRLLVELQPKIYLATHGPELHDQCCRFLHSLGYSLSPVTGAGTVEDTDEIVAVAKR